MQPLFYHFIPNISSGRRNKCVFIHVCEKRIMYDVVFLISFRFSIL